MDPEGAAIFRGWCEVHEYKLVMSQTGFMGATTRSESEATILAIGDSKSDAVFGPGACRSAEVVGDR